MRWDLFTFWLTFIIIVGVGGRILSEIIGRLDDWIRG